MNIILDELREFQKVPNKSKVMFTGDFHGEIKCLMKKIETAIKERVSKKYHIEYYSFGKSSLKIKINDKDSCIEKLITCNFTYNKTDEKFGYLDPQFLSDELSKKTLIYNMGKFSILDQDKLIDAFIKKLIFIIEEY